MTILSMDGVSWSRVYRWSRMGSRAVLGYPFVFDIGHVSAVASCVGMIVDYLGAAVRQGNPV